jgi:hypothetical protein
MQNVYLQIKIRGTAGVGQNKWNSANITPIFQCTIISKYIDTNFILGLYIHCR